jgi:hypothetical protein
MPLIMGLLCGLAMLSTPIFLLALLMPMVSFNIDGHEVTFREMWKSGLGLTLVSSLLLGGVASWGLALRWPAARWLAVASTIAPVAVAALFPRSEMLSVYQQSSAIFLTLPNAIGMYLCLFYIPSVRRYLSDATLATTPNKSLERTREG